MDFEQHFIILGASIMNVFLLWIWGIGFFMVNESRNPWDVFFGCIFITVSSGLQSFALVYWLSSFIN